MKTLILTAVFCLGCIQMNTAQVAELTSEKTPQELYEFHINKKKKNNLAGWATLSGGLAMVVGGVAISLDNCLLGGCNDGQALAIVGGVTSLSSIYFFRNAYNHKKKANIQLQNGAVGINRDIRYSGISISFDF